MNLLHVFQRLFFAKQPFFMLIVGIVIIASCAKPTPTPVSIVRSWVVQTNETATGYSQLEQLCFLSMYHDGSYTMGGKGKFTTGKWQYNEKLKVLHLSPATKSTELLDAYLQVDTLNERSLEARLFRNPSMEEGTEESFLQCIAVPTERNKDPFSVSANAWRLRPATPQTDDQIKQKVLQYLGTYRQYLAIGNEAKTEMLSVAWLPQPIQMQFSNGARLAYSDELADWNTCFFDSAQSVSAYKVLSGSFSKLTIKKNNNMIQRNMDLLDQLTKVINQP